MKRLVLVLALAATAVLGTGCGDHCRRNVTLDWSQGFLGADGQRRTDCGAAGVSFVAVFINDDPNSENDFDCSAFAGEVGDVGSGTNLYTVEGIESNGRIAYRDEVRLDAACGNQQVAVSPAEGTLVVDYHFTPTDACVSGRTTYMWTKVRDDIANVTAFTDTDQSSANQCGATLSFLLPAGSFTLLGINEWGNGYFAADCTDRSFDISGATQTTVTTRLSNSTVACF